MKKITTVFVCTVMAMSLVFLSCEKKTGDSSGVSAKATNITVMYKEVKGYPQWLEQVKAQFESAHPDVTVKLSMLQSTEADYNTKTALILQTDNSVDVLLVDSFLVPSLVAGQNLEELPVSTWADWTTQYPEGIREQQEINGKTYSILFNTDTRGLFYNAKVFENAGISTPWQPKDWNDIIVTIQELQKSGVLYPFWFNAAKSQGEATAMQTFEMLLSGTEDWLYENDKWVVKSKGFTDSLEFIQKLYEMKIFGNNQLATVLDVNAWRYMTEAFPKTTDIAITFDGVWKGNDWYAALGDDAPNVIKVTKMPKQYGNGFTSMSGGWTLGVSPLSKNKDLAFEFITLANSKENTLKLVNGTNDMAVRKDVASDPVYIEPNVYRSQMTDWIEFAKFRPGAEAYPAVSIEIQTAVESVITGQKTAQQAAETYAANVIKIVGKENCIEK